MTVLRMNPTEEYTAPRRGYPFADSGPRGAQPVPASRQIQNWTRGMEISSGGRRGVIAERRTSLPVRRDVLKTALAVLLVLLICVLAADVGALRAGGERIVRLTSGIESLEGANSMLRQELSAAMNHPVLRNRETSAELNETVVVLSPAPEE